MNEKKANLLERNSEKTKYKNQISGLVAIKHCCINVVKTLAPIVADKNDFKEFGKGLKKFFSFEEIAKAFCNKDLIHLAKKTMLGAGCKTKKIEETLKKAKYTETEIYLAINEVTLTEEEVLS